LETLNDIEIVSAYFLWWNKIFFDFYFIYFCYAKRNIHHR